MKSGAGRVDHSLKALIAFGVELNLGKAMSLNQLNRFVQVESGEINDRRKGNIENFEWRIVRPD